MSKKNKRFFYQFLGFLIPFFTLITPSFISIAGVVPRWAELWLLPWALEEGPFAGVFGGFCLGMILDAINLDGVTQVPALVILGYLWGRLGRKQEFSENNFSLGILAWLGSLLSCCFLWGQQLFLVKGSALTIFNAWAFHTLFLGAIITALIAPLFCSCMLRIFFQGKT